MQLFVGVVVQRCCKQKKTALEDALKLTSNNLPQDLIKIKQSRKQMLFFLQNVAKKRGLSSPCDCLEAKQQRSVVVICCHILLLCHRSAVQPRRKKRSSAQCAAAGRSHADRGVPDHF